MTDTKTIQLKGAPGNGKAPHETKRGTVLFKTTATLKTGDVRKLMQFISVAQMYNYGVSSRTAKWLGKNLMALMHTQELIDSDEKPLKDRMAEFMASVKTFSNGSYVLWDGVEDNIVYSDAENKVVDASKSTFGIRAYMKQIKDENNPQRSMNVLTNLSNHQPITDPGVLKTLKEYFIEDKKTRDEFKAFLPEYDTGIKKVGEKTWTVDLLKINEGYLEQTAFRMPAAQQNGQVTDLGLATNVLIHSEDEGDE